MEQLLTGYSLIVDHCEFRILPKLGGRIDLEVHGEIVSTVSSTEIAARKAGQTAELMGLQVTGGYDQIEHLANWTYFDFDPGPDEGV